MNPLLLVLVLVVVLGFAGFFEDEDENEDEDEPASGCKLAPMGDRRLLGKPSHGSILIEIPSNLTYPVCG